MYKAEDFVFRDMDYHPELPVCAKTRLFLNISKILDASTL